MQAKAIKNILMIAGAAVGAFLVALFGAYLFLPLAQPSMVDEVEDPSGAERDSGATRATMSGPGSTGGRSEGTEGAPTEVSTASAQGRVDEAPTETAPDEDSVQVEPDTSRSMKSNVAITEKLRDSLQTLQNRLRSAQEEATTLREETEALRGRVASLERKQAKVNELSSALMDMGQNELTTLLQEVDMTVLEALYQETSGRSRTRLLQAMSSERAARFVNDVVGADTSATPDTSGASAGAPGPRESVVTSN